jgi:plastocyanin
VQHRTPLIAAALFALGFLGACGDDDPPAAAAASESTSESTTVTVETGDFVFDPTPVEVHVGDSVRWENTHTQAHTSTGNGDQDWNTANIDPGATSDPVQFDEEGTFTYVCALHPFMEGTVEVSA